MTADPARYRLGDYGRMIASRLRTDAYLQALRHAVTPDSVVLDLGTGTGFFALQACKFGARRVYAIESGDVIQVARDLAAANGYGDRIHFIQDLSTRVTLPEKADVIVSDLHGVLPFYELHIPSVVDARRRFLAPGGTLIPKRDAVWGAVVEAPNMYDRHIAPWEDPRRDGLDMRVARRMVANTWWKERVASGQFLVQPQCWVMLDYASIESPDMQAAVTWTVTRAGTAHGLIAWFDATLADGIGFSNASDKPEEIYGSAFFPWLEPVSLAPGDTVSVTAQAKLVGEEDYEWRWDSTVLEPSHPARVKAGFKQSTLLGVPLSLARLHRYEAGHIPMLNEEGRIDRVILEKMDGRTSLGAIARQLATQFPHRFSTWEEAFTRIGRLSVHYSQQAPT